MYLIRSVIVVINKYLMINTLSGKAEGFVLAQSALCRDGPNSELNSLPFYLNYLPKEPSQNAQENLQPAVSSMRLTPDQVHNLQEQRMPPEGQFH